MVDAQGVHHRWSSRFYIRRNHFLKFLTANTTGPGVSVIKLDDIPKTRKTKLPGCNETETYIALEKDLLQNGMNEPIQIKKSDGTVIRGDQRCLFARKNKYTHISYVLVDE